MIILRVAKLALIKRLTSSGVPALRLDILKKKPTALKKKLIVMMGNPKLIKLKEIRKPISAAFAVLV